MSRIHTMKSIIEKHRNDRRQSEEMLAVIPLLDALNTIRLSMGSHPDVKRGNSTVHFAYRLANTVINQALGDRP